MSCLVDQVTGTRVNFLLFGQRLLFPWVFISTFLSRGLYSVYYEGVVCVEDYRLVQVSRVMFLDIKIYHPNRGGTLDIRLRESIK